MTDLFCTHKQSIALKEIGFDYPCMRYVYVWNFNDPLVEYDETLKPQNFNRDQTTISIPLYDQIFKWFREKFNINAQLTTTYNEWDYYIPASEYNETPIRHGSDNWTYEQARSACVDTLIKLVSNEREAA